MTPDTWEQNWLPQVPFATDDLLDGIWRVERNRALGMKYIQANGSRLANTLTVDIDHSDAELRAMSCSAQPNIIATNPQNGHAHAMWMIQEPVTTTDMGSYRALKYLTSVTEGLRRAVDGDVGFAGLMTRNPTHSAWQTVWFNPDLWELRGLEMKLGGCMPPKGWRRRSDSPDISGLGRNCALFDEARQWSYRAAKHYRGDRRGLEMAIQARVDELNTAFPVPLPQMEARTIAKSIHKWIVKRFAGFDGSWDEESFRRRQTERSARGTKRLAERSAERLALMDRFVPGAAVPSVPAVPSVTVETGTIGTERLGV